VNDPGAQQVRIIVRPNRSLPARVAWAVFLGTAALCLVIGTGFLLAGAWPVLPFMGLESLLVGAALYHAMQHADDREIVTVSDSKLELRRFVGKGKSSYEFQRYWVRLKLERTAARRGASRLLVGSHGRWIEVGAFLGERQRRALYRRLGRVLRGAPGDGSGAIR
jgi:uncharacterized membrane protein